MTTPANTEPDETPAPTDSVEGDGRECHECGTPLKTGKPRCHGCGSRYRKHPKRRGRIIKSVLGSVALLLIAAVAATAYVIKSTTDSVSQSGLSGPTSHKGGKSKKQTPAEKRAYYRERQRELDRQLAATPGAKSIPGDRLPGEAAFSKRERRALALLREAEAARDAMKLCIPKKKSSSECAADDALALYLREVATDPTKYGPAIAAAAMTVRVATGEDVEIIDVDTDVGYSLSAHNARLGMTYKMPSSIIEPITCERDVMEGTAEAQEVDATAGPLCKDSVVEFPRPVTDK